MKRFLLLAAAVAVADDHPSGPRMTPPTIRQVAPLGIARGMTVEMTVEGFNLAGAKSVFFSEPGIKAKILRIKELPDLPDIRLGSNNTPSTIDLGPLPPRNQITMEVDVAPDADIGPVSFRVQTPLGSSPVGTFLIEPFYGESPDNEPNDTPDTGFESYLPSILAGTISKPGDIDMFKIKVKAGQELTFDNSAAMAGSQLQPVVAIVAPDMSVLAEFGTDGGRDTRTFSHKFANAGTYYVRVSDYQQKGTAGHFYRIKVGDFPIVSSVYPLGVKRGTAAKVQVSGQNLGTTAMEVKGVPTGEDPDAVLLRVNAPGGHSFNEVKLDISDEPEVDAATAKVLTLPVTVNGKITKGPQDFRFRAKKEQEIVFEVKARRFGSDLDSYVEVLDATGKPVEQATVRPVWETILTLRDHDSVLPGLRLQNWNALQVGDYVQAGSEIVRVRALPRGPDDDTIFESFGNQRLGYFGTTPEAHANDSPAYKVLIFPPGKQFSPNGLPLTRLYFRNDDGGPTYGKDSYLRFVAPADGEYIVRIGDVQGLGGESYAYRLTARAPRPDFRLSITPRNPNVPAGGTIPLTVTAARVDGFEDPIELELEGLPAGVTATKGVIAKGQMFGTVLLSATADASLPQSASMRLIGKSGKVIREANQGDSLKLITVGPKPDLVMVAETTEVEIEAGGTAEVAVSITRQNGFAGRVPVEVRNLPPSVRVLDVGLNGVLLNEDETKRSFTLAALPSAEPIEQMIYVSGQIETRSTQQNSYAAIQPIRLRVKANPAREVSSAGKPVVAGAPNK